MFRLFRRKVEEPKEVKSQVSEVIWPLPQGSFIEYAFGKGGRISAQKAMEFYRTNSTVATAVDKIASKVEQITPVLQTKDNKFIKDHPVIDLLKNPNPFNTWHEFVGKIARHYLLKHDSYLAMLGNVQRAPIEIYSIKPQNVSTLQAIDYLPASYNITVGPARGHYMRSEISGNARFLDGDLKELYHIMGFSSRSDDIEGDSPLEAAALETRQQIQGRAHNLSLLKNGGRLSLVVSFKDPDGVDDDEHQRRKKRINEDLGGAGNAGKIAVISGAQVDVKEVGISNKDMDYAILDSVASQAIYLRYEIPLPLISTDASTYNNIENALFDFYENTVLPLADILFAGMSKVLLPRYGIDDMVISYDPESIGILIRQKMQEIKNRKEVNIETINELRALLPNREPIGGGGDTLYQPATMVPVGEDLFTDDNLTPEQLAEQLRREAGVEE